jgi:hypothetical protein
MQGKQIGSQMQSVIVDVDDQTLPQADPSDLPGWFFCFFFSRGSICPGFPEICLHAHYI